MSHAAPTVLPAAGSKGTERQGTAFLVGTYSCYSPSLLLSALAVPFRERLERGDAVGDNVARVATHCVITMILIHNDPHSIDY